MIYILDMSRYSKSNQHYPLRTFDPQKVEMNKKGRLSLNKQKTREAIAAAFVRLLKSRSFEDISIQDIVEECGMARSTFYRYFPDKYGVAAWYYFDKLLTPMDQSWPFPRYFSQFVQMIKDNRTFFSKCLETLSQNSLLEEIHTHAINSLCMLIHAQKEVTPEVLLQVKSFVAGCEYILFEWLNTNCDENVDQIVAALMATMPGSLKGFVLGKNA